MKKKVLKVLPDAFCCRCRYPIGYIVWPGKIQPRGFEQSAVGFGKTARDAWKSVKLKKLKFE